MRSIVLAIAFLFSAVSYADVLKCTFTEPFVDFDYDTNSNVMTIHGSDIKTERLTDISLEFTGVNSFNLIDANKKVVAELLINFNGSNGMGPVIYPFEARWYYHSADGLWGGCSSNKLASIFPRE